MKIVKDMERASLSMPTGISTKGDYENGEPHRKGVYKSESCVFIGFLSLFSIIISNK